MKASPVPTSNNAQALLVEKLINIDDLIEITPAELEKLRSRPITNSFIKRVTNSPGKDSRAPTESMINGNDEFEEVAMKEAKKEYFPKKQYFLPEKYQAVKRFSKMIRAKSPNTVRFE